MAFDSSEQSLGQIRSRSVTERLISLVRKVEWRTSNEKRAAVRIDIGDTMSRLASWAIDRKWNRFDADKRCRRTAEETATLIGVSRKDESRKTKTSDLERHPRDNIIIMKAHVSDGSL